MASISFTEILKTMVSISFTDLTLMLTVHKPTQRVLFAETNRITVNFLLDRSAFALKPATDSDGGQDHRTLVPDACVPKEDPIVYPAIEILGGHDRPSLPNEDLPKANNLKALFTFEGDYDSVKPPMFCLITDELVVKQWSLWSGLSIMKDFNLVGCNELEQVLLETPEILRLARMGFEGENTLTSMFLGK